jgi:hypothetical protein
MRHNIVDYRTVGRWLSDYNFLLQSDYRNIDFRTGEFEKLSDYRTFESSRRSIGLSDSPIDFYVYFLSFLKYLVKCST